MSPAAISSQALAQLDSLHRLARHLARDAAEADDLVQEAFVSALRSASTYRQTENGIRPWLFKILHNCLRQRRRRDSKVRFNSDELPESIDETGGEVFGQLMTANASLDELDWDQVDERLKAAIGGLPENLKIIFLLFAIEDLKYREIAEVLDIPTGTVMSRLARARRLIVEGLASAGVDPEGRSSRTGIVQRDSLAS